MIRGPYSISIYGVLALLSIPAAAQNTVSAHTPLNERVLVVYKSNGADSLNVAKYDMAQRKIPQANRCKVAVTSTDRIDQHEFESRVKTPVPGSRQ
jgi:hypothetical protein